MIAIWATILLGALPQADDPFRSRRPEHRERLLQRGGGSKETEAAVRGALEWLARNQRADHSWPVEDKSFTVGVTALSVLAFLGTGHGPKSPSFGEPIRRGLQYLLAAQDKDGCIGLRGEKYMYHHILATTALAEAHGMNPAESYGPPAQKAVDFLIAAQTPGKGWRYSSNCGESDTSVTGWAVLALRASERAMLSFPKKAYVGAVSWLDEVTTKEGRASYKGTFQDGGQPGVGEPYDRHETMSAMSVLARVLMQKRRMDERLDAGLNWLVKDPPKGGRNSVDYVYWHVGSRAIFEIVGPDDERWKTWNEALKKALLEMQTKEGPHAGSWETMDRWCWEGGRACTTALNALTLQTYYRYVQWFGSDEK